MRSNRTLCQVGFVWHVSMLACAVLTSLYAQPVEESSQDEIAPLPRQASVEIAIPKSVSASEDQAKNILQNLITSILVANAELMQLEFSKQMAIANTPIEKQRLTRFPLFRGFLTREREEQILNLVVEKDMAHYLIEELRGLDIIVDVTLQIHPGIRRAEVAFPKPSGDFQEEIAKVEVEASAAPKITIKALSLSLENVPMNERVEIDTLPLLKDRERFSLQSTDMNLRAEVSAIENLASRKEDEPLLRVPLVGFKTNFKDVEIRRETARQIVERVLSREQVASLLSALSELSFLNHLMQFTETEMKSRLRQLNLKVGIVVALKEDFQKFPLSEQFETIVAPLQSKLRDSVELYSKQNRLVYFGTLDLPTEVREFKANLDLNKLYLDTQITLPSQMTARLKSQKIFLPEALAWQLSRLNPTASLLNSLVGQNLSAAGLDIELTLSSNEKTNQTHLPLRWNGDDLEWDVESLNVQLPVLDQLMIYSLKIKGGGHDVVYGLRDPRVFGAQFLRSLPQLATLVSGMINDDVFQLLRSDAIAFANDQIAKLQTIPLNLGDVQMGLHIQKFQLPEDALSIHLKAPRAGSDPRVIYEVNIEARLPDEMVIALERVHTEVANLQSASIHLQNQAPKDVKFKMTFAAKLETRTKNGVFEYRIIHDALESDLSSAASKIVVQSVTVNGVELSGLAGRITSGLDELSSFFGFSLGLNDLIRDQAASTISAKIDEAKMSGISSLPQAFTRVLNGSEDAWTANDENPQFKTQGASTLITYHLQKKTESLAKQLEYSWRQTAEKQLRDLLISKMRDQAQTTAKALASGKTDAQDQNLSLFPSNLNLKRWKADLMNTVVEWMATGISSNAAGLEEAIKELYQKEVQQLVEKLVVDKANAAREPSASQSDRMQISFGAPQPGANISPLQRDELMKDSHLRAVIYLSFFNEFLKENLAVFAKMVEDKAKENPFINRTFHVEFAAPISTQGKFFFINDQGNLELRLGVKLEQDSIVAQTVTSLPGYIFDGLISLFAKQDVNLFRTIFAAPGGLIDLLGSPITDLNTRGFAELQAPIRLKLGNKSEPSIEKYLLEIEVLDVNLVYVDPVTLLTKVSMDWVAPSILKGFKQTIEVERPQLPVVKDLLAFKLQEGLIPLITEKSQGIEAITFSVEPVYHFDLDRRPRLVFDSAMPLEASKDQTAEAETPPGTSSPIKIPAFKLFNIQTSESDYYTIFAYLKADFTP